MNVKLAAFLVIASVAAAQTPTPSLQQYLTARQVGAQQLFSSILNSPLPQPVFGTQILAIQATQCHYNSQTGGSGQNAFCGAEPMHTIFSVQQGENMVDWMLAAGFTNAAVNVDLPMFIDNLGNSIAARGVFNSVLAYAQSKGMAIVLKPTYGGTQLATWTVCMPVAGQTITGGSSTASTITFNVAATNVCGSGTTGCYYAGGTLSTSTTTTPAALAGMNFTIASVTSTPVKVNSTLNVAPTGGTTIGWSVSTLQTCVTAENTMLKVGGTTACSGFGTGCSPGAFLAATYSPKRYTVVNEPVTENPLLGVTFASLTGTSAQWKAYGSATAAQVVANSPATKVGFALSRLDNIMNEHTMMQGITVASQTPAGGSSTASGTTINVSSTAGIQVGRNVTVAGASPSGCNGTFTVTSIVTNTSVTMNNTSNPGSCSGGTLTSPPAYGAYDVYTDDPGNTINGLGLEQQNWQSDQAAGLETIWSEMWIPAWSPGGEVGGTQTNYEGIGNCDWTTYGINRLSLGSLAVFGAANGMTEIDMFSAAYAGVACVYASPGFPASNDCVTCAPYVEAVATALGSSSVAAQRTPLFYVLQNLIRWFPIAAGQPLPL